MKIYDIVFQNRIIIFFKNESILNLPLTDA